MNSLTKVSLLLSFLYLLLGSLLGLMLGYKQTASSLFSMGGSPTLAHAHLQLVGFVTQMIVGVTYHIVPMLSRGKINSFKLGYLHTALLNAGLLIQVWGFLTDRILFKSFGSLLLFASIVMYLFNILKSMKWR
ncbi:MAG: cbb3-type cytochrome c oxidase subunit I [Hydrogenobacter thermophilus]|uniref:hypothetical protein n=1 Tax=Hydrogenobacter thermophilus TaxID=940 RepID=UPI001C77CED3|nr:hypothetical protein [Hydrogenobacter thermophilus]QWK20544.1 MAG: cbb3-type cytochrome c oxidase subunit I [Hydrogenobacter thermophilus]